MSAKLNAVVDGLGNLVAFVLSAENDYDSVHVIELLDESGLTGAAYR